MRLTSRCIALLLALLLVAQAAWAAPECGSTMANIASHHGMDASDHSGKPAPSGHHLPCQAAACATMAACAPLALAEPTQNPAPPIAATLLPPVSRTALVPSGLRPPDPPPPRT